MRLIIRGYADKKKIFEDHIEVADDDEAIRDIAERHCLSLAHHKHHMIEVEFLDAPPEERFLRFGTDPRQMVRPVKLDLTKVKKKCRNRN